MIFFNTFSFMVLDSDRSKWTSDIENASWNTGK